MGGKLRTEAERFDLMEKAIVMRIEGIPRTQIVKSLGIGITTFERWRTSKDWQDIKSDVDQMRKREAATYWRTKLQTAGRMIEKLADEGDVNGTSYIEAIRYIVDSQDLGPKGDENGSEESSSTPVQIVINAADRPALEADLRATLGSTRADRVDATEGGVPAPGLLDSSDNDG